MRVLRHILVTVAASVLILGVPFMTSDYFKGIVSGSGADAVSGASLVVEQPSGSYTVLINLKLHSNEDNLALWEDFFEGRETSFILEDVKCTAANGDPGGIQLAENYMTRLPENQMKLKKEDPTLMLSKAEHGKFDIIVMSDEMAQLNRADTLYSREDIMVLHVKGAEQ